MFDLSQSVVPVLDAPRNLGDELVDELALLHRRHVHDTRLCPGAGLPAPSRRAGCPRAWRAFERQTEAAQQLARLAAGEVLAALCAVLGVQALAVLLVRECRGRRARSGSRVTCEAWRWGGSEISGMGCVSLQCYGLAAIAIAARTASLASSIDALAHSAYQDVAERFCHAERSAALPSAARAPGRRACTTHSCSTGWHSRLGESQSRRATRLSQKAIAASPGRPPVQRHYRAERVGVGVARSISRTSRAHLTGNGS